MKFRSDVEFVLIFMDLFKNFTVLFFFGIGLHDIVLE